MIILGIDPGLANTGWAVIKTNGYEARALAYGCVTTKASDPLTSRLSKIYNEIERVFKEFKPVECAVEGVFFGVNPKSALSLGQARGIALFAAVNNGVKVFEYSATQVKSNIVGEGRAEKEQVAFMVQALLKLDHTPKNEHSSDALAIALTHAFNQDKENNSLSD